MPNLFSIGDLSATDGFVINGVANIDSAGSSVAIVGDVNGDGIDDFLVGAQNARPYGRGSAGEVYVVFGTSDGFPTALDLSSLDGSNGFVLFGAAAGDNAGYSVSAAGDINGDGLADIIIGAPASYPFNTTETGTAYVLFGSSEDFAAGIELSSLDGTNGFVINGLDPDDGLGTGVSNIGDVNGDGIDDIIIGAPYADPEGRANAGESYVLFGSTTGFGASVDLSSLDGTNGFRILGATEGDIAGYSVSGAGDINADGIADIIIGAPRAEPNDNNLAGEAYVIFGSTTGFSATIDLAALDGSNGFTLQGANVNDFAGFSVSAAGDINNDGIDDIVVGVPIAGSGNRDSSAIVFGSTDGFSSVISLGSLDGINGFSAIGAGSSVSSAGDINNDGIDDLVFGSSISGTGGRAFVLFGRSDGFSASVDLFGLDGSNGFIVSSSVSFDSVGSAVGGGTDVNGDGIDDLLIGVQGLGDEGGAVVIFGAGDIGSRGRLFSGSALDETISGTMQMDTLSGGDGDDVLSGGDSADILQGGTGNDRFNGGSGNDTIDGGAGVDSINFVFGTVGVVVDLAAGVANDDHGDADTLIDIEDVLGSIFDDVIAGNESNNNLIGNSGNDVLEGRAGDDTLVGGSGDDTLDGGDGRDVASFNGEFFAVSVNLASGSAVYTGNPAYIDTLVNIEDVIGTKFGNDTIMGDDNDNHLSGIGGNDQLAGGVGNDTLEGGAGADELDGGEGVDTASYADSASAVTANLNTNAFTNGDAEGDTLTDIENLIGSAFTDQLVGDALANVLEGGAGADTLDGGGGVDTASYVGSASAVTANLNTSAFTGGDAEGDTLTSIENLTGSAFADQLVGDAIANALDGGLGDDTLDGGRGSDTLEGGDGNDLLRGGTQADVLDGGAGNDNLLGGNGNDTVAGGSGNDTLSGSVGDDSLSGNGGGDRLFGDAGADTLNGGGGSDRVDYLRDDADILIDLETGETSGGFAEGDVLTSIESVFGGTGNDTLRAIEGGSRLNGAGGDDSIIGRGGNDRLAGGNGNDVVTGGAGNDLLNGGRGEDTLTGGAGDDTIRGSSGSDTFVFSAGTGDDTVLDFRSNDLIDLSATTTDFTDLASVQAAATEQDGGLLIDLGGGDSLFLEGVASADLSASNLGL